MSISDNYVPDVSAGNGVTVAFSGSWNVIAAVYMVVQLQNTSTLAFTPLTLGTDYTLVFTSSGYTITCTVAPATGYNVIRSRNIAKTQIVPYRTSTGFQGLVEENSFDKITAITQDLQENVNRTLLFPIGTTATGTLPVPIDGYGLIWSGTSGAIVNTSVSMALLQSQAASLAAIETQIVTVAGISASVTAVAGNAANINTVAGISGAVSTVGGIAAAVSTVAGISGNVTTVAGIQANVTTVAGIAASVSTVAGISANVTSVAGNATNINAVATDLTNINAVATDLTNINAVAGDLTAINAVNANATNINTVAGISSSVSTVAGINAAVSTVAGISTAVSGVNAIAANVTTVAGVAPNVTTVAGISASVSTVAGISGNVTTVAGVSAAVTTVAGISSAVSTVSGINAAVSTVSGINAAVSTVSGIQANVTTVAGISGNVTTVAGVSANVTTVATNIASVNTVATNIASVINAANNIPKANLSATVAPTVNNDNTQGYSAGSLWTDTTHNQVYIASSVATGAANWIQAFSASALSSLSDVSTASLASHDTLQYNAGTSKWNNVAAATALSNIGGAPLASPALTGTPTVPTAATGTNTTQAASTAFAMTAATNAALAANAGNSVDITSTASLTGTYTSVAAGIGDTFTVTATGVQTVDGQTVSLNNLILLKDQASAFQNGIYKVTVAGALAVSPVYTRALDYDQASDINNTGPVSIINGTTNGGTAYILTTKVTNVGTDALTYAIFTPKYANIVQSGGALGTPSSGNVSNCTSTTQSAGDNSTKIATTAYVDTKASGTGYNAQTTTYAIIASDAGKTVDFTGSSNTTFTLTSGSTLGATFSCLVANSGTSNAILTLASSAGTIDGVATTGYKMYPGEVRRVDCNGTNFITKVIHSGTAIFTTSGSWQKPPGYNKFFVELISGGGSGAVRTTTGNSSGGGGGTSFYQTLNSSAFVAVASTETITVAGISASVASSNANGNVGNHSAITINGVTFTTSGSVAATSAAASGATTGGQGDTNITSATANNSVTNTGMANGWIYEFSAYTVGGAVSASNVPATGQGGLNTGGGGGSSNTAGGVRTGGIPLNTIGVGGVGSSTAGAGVGNGVQPGGGGGGAVAGSASGSGAAGQITITGII